MTSGDDGQADDADVQVLAGGMGNGGAVVRIGDTVRRPASPHERATSALLAGLFGVGFPAPVRLGTEKDGTGLFQWIEGAVPVPPYQSWSLSDAALRSVGRLLRRYHTAVAALSLPAGLDWSQELADPHGGPIISHNDVCPENVVFRGAEAVALLDFDLAAPGRPVWDLAGAAYMWIPLRPPELAGIRSHLDPFQRLAVLAHAYGLEPADRAALVDAVIERQRVGARFVESRVRAGEPAFIAVWGETGGTAIHARIGAWLDANADALLRALS